MKQNREKNISKDKIEKLTFLFNQGKLLELIKEAKQLITKYPSSIFLWNILGASNARLKKLNESEKCFYTSIKLNPNFIEGYYNLGKTQKELGKLTEAILSYKKAIEIKPDYAEAYNNLGNIQKELGKLTEAILSYKKAIEIKPDYAEAYNNLGNIQKELGKLTEAILSYKKAIEIKPDFAEFYNEIGGAQIEVGKISEGVSSYKKAIEIKSDFAEAYNNYTDSVKIQINDPILLKLDKLINKKNLSGKDSTYLFFAMGKAQLDIGNSEKALQLINTGNSLRKKELKYKIQKSKDIFNKIKNNFKELNIKNEKTSPDSISQPIFIVGMPRSGTTLVEQILSSHSAIYGAGELNFLDNAINLIDWQNNKIQKKDIMEIRKNYINELKKISKSTYTTDKMPLNFRWIGFIAYAFPNAKIIHVKRDAMATCWSNYKTNFSKGGLAFAFDQIDIVEYYKLYENLMDFWQKKFPGKIYELNYDKLTENQELESRKMFNYLGLKWENSVLEFHNNNRVVQTASNIQVRKKMYKGSSQQWKKYKSWLQPMLNNLKKN